MAVDVQTLVIRDNGGKTGDRYTIVDREQEIGINCSTSPCHPMGVWDAFEIEHCHAEWFHAVVAEDDDTDPDILEKFGPSITWEELPESVQTKVENFLNDD